MKWEPGAREDDSINRSSVELAKRHRGQLVNEKASRRAKVQALANTNSKLKTTLLLVEKSSRLMLLTIGNI